MPLPRRYAPRSLSPRDRRAQLRSIAEGTDRPKLRSFTSRRSRWVRRFEAAHARKITDVRWIARHLLAREGIEGVLRKGMAAYYTSGSRPNQTKESWAYARLASVLMGGPARRVDRALWEAHRVRRTAT